MRGSRWRRSATAAVLAVALAGLVAATVSARYPPQLVQQRNRQVWLASPGLVSLVDGGTGDLVQEFQVPGKVQVAQFGDDAVALSDNGMLTRLQYAALTATGVAHPFGTDLPLTLVSGGDRLYAVPSSGRISAFDVRSSSITGTVPVPPGKLVQAADAQGRLWLLDQVSGRLSGFDPATARVAAGAGAVPGGVLVPGPDVVRVDLRRRRLDVPATGATCTVLAPLEGAVLGAGDRPATLLAASPATGEVRRFDLGVRDAQGRCGVTMTRAEPGRDWGRPLAAGGLIYLPDHGRGAVQVLDPARGRATVTVQLAPRGIPVSLQERAGLVYYNDPDDYSTAGVVHPDGEVTRIEKFRPRPTPSQTSHRPASSVPSSPKPTPSLQAAGPKSQGTHDPTRGSGPRPAPGPDSPGSGVPVGDESNGARPADDGQVTLTVRRHAGRVVSTPAGIACPEQYCTARFAPGTRVVVTATGLTGETGLPVVTGGGCRGTTTCTVTLHGDTTLEVTLLAPPRLEPPSGVAVYQRWWPYDNDLMQYTYGRSNTDPVPSVWAWVDQTGRVLYGYVPDNAHPADVHWQVLSGPGEFTGRPEIVENAKDGLSVVAQARDGRLRSTATAADEGGRWTSWRTLATGVALLPRTRGIGFYEPDPPGAVSRNCPAVLGLDGNGGLWQVFPARPASTRLLGRSPLVTGSVAPAPDSYRLVGVTSVGGLRSAAIGCDGSVGAWTRLGTAHAADPPALLRLGPEESLDLDLVIRTADGRVLERRAVPPPVDTTLPCLLFPKVWTAIGDLRLQRVTAVPGLGGGHRFTMAFGRLEDGTVMYTGVPVKDACDHPAQPWTKLPGFRPEAPTDRPTAVEYSVSGLDKMMGLLVLTRTVDDQLQYAIRAHFPIEQPCVEPVPEAQQPACAGLRVGLMPAVPPASTRPLASG